MEFTQHSKISNLNLTKQVLETGAIGSHTLVSLVKREICIQTQRVRVRCHKTRGVPPANTVSIHSRSIFCPLTITAAVPP